MKRIAALVPSLLGVSPGQRVRIESWVPYLRQAGWTIDLYPFEDDRLHNVLYEPVAPYKKAVHLLSCYRRRLDLVLKRPPCDLLFIFREAALIGPAIIERLATRLRVPIIYDLDDPVFLPYRSPMNGWLSLLKFSRKTHTIFRISNQVIAINSLLAEYVSRFNTNISVIPNCVDTEHYRPGPTSEGGPVRLVWIGSHSTMANLVAIAPVLRRLHSETGIVVRVIGAGGVEIPGVRTEIRQWSASSELGDLQECDIGLVPLPDHHWHPWKFFFKTIQYMAVGLPVVARSVGSNTEIIEDGTNGFLVETEEEWYERLSMLIRDRPLRNRMGEAARATIVRRYSMQVQMPRMISVFEQTLRRGCQERKQI